MIALVHKREPATVSKERRGMLAKIHIAVKDLKLSRDAYGDVMERLFAQRSAAHLSDAQLHRLLGEFKRLGWSGPVHGKPAGRPNVRLIHALWRDLAAYVTDPSDEALRSFVRRQTKGPLHPGGVDAAEFLEPAQANLVIEGLKGWLARARRDVAREIEKRERTS